MNTITRDHPYQLTMKYLVTWSTPSLVVSVGWLWNSSGVYFASSQRRRREKLL